jgi:PKD repeat protein
MRATAAVLLTALCAAPLAAAERINHEGRILGDLPTVTAPILFNTAAADAVVSALQIMPRDNPWNEDISARPLLANSDAMIAAIRAQFTQANRKRAVLFQEMNYVLVPDGQPLVDINFTLYYEDADFNGGTSPVGRYPIPANQPVEGWPANGEELYAYQRMTGGDRHTITVQPGAGRFFETWLGVLTANTPAWEASNGAIFNLASNAIRTPDGIGSGDAAGLPMLPALVRYDEIQRGVVEHALRLIVGRTRDHHIYPATHDASVPRTTDPNVPAMGERLRLKASFAIPASWTPAERAVAVALKKYGAIMADNGGFFSMSICPDDRWAPGTWDHFATGAASDFLDISNFEVIQTTGPSEGPRSPGAPTANAGADQTTTLAAGATLAGTVTGSGLTTQWYLYPYATQPGTVTFATPAALTTTATFSAAGTYTLMLKASDGVHTPAYDAVLVTVGAAPADTTAPVIDTLAASPNPVTAGSATLSATAHDNVAVTGWQWSRVSGPGTVGFTAATQASSGATFLSAGTYVLRLTVRDAAGNSASSDLTVVSTADIAVPLITSPATASAVVGQPFAFTVSASGNPSFAASGRPAWLALDAVSGLLSGTPPAAGSVTLALTASNLAGSAGQSLVITVLPPAPVITSATSARVTMGQPFAYVITASNAPTAFAASGLPPGLTVNNLSARISGTPTAAGTYPVQISASNGGGTGSATLTLTVDAPAAPVIAGPATAAATVGQPLSLQIVASNAPTAYAASGLPAGLALAATSGLISGTPTAAGSATVALTASNAAGAGNATLMITVAAAAAETPAPGAAPVLLPPQPALGAAGGGGGGSGGCGLGSGLGLAALALFALRLAWRRARP